MMASLEHLNLSCFIKSVHESLRREALNVGPEIAWKKHCEDDENLKKYSKSMRKLATEHWDKANDEALNSRIKWVCNTSEEYFTERITKCRQKECTISELANIKDLNFRNFPEKLRVLDVGSCYNPFNIYSKFDVLPIDIAPADYSVYKCDFLNVTLTNNDCNKEWSSSNNQITHLEKNSFDVVVFCLLLEYIPTPEQRLICCEKAYDLLHFEGLLFIITPDSKHVGANAKIMKTWRYLLAEIGFSRIKYNKLKHLHCMAFRKSSKQEIAQRWAKLHENHKTYDNIVIPQDFN